MILVNILLSLLLSFSAAEEEKPELKQKETAYLAGEISKANDGGVTGESFAWHINYFLGPVLSNCKNGNDDWMAPTERILNMLADKMATGPDGYKGFIGPYIYNEKEYWCDVHVGDAILISHMLHFATIVHDNPALKGKYGKSAERFVNIAKKDLIEKWDKRGTFIVDGPFAGYREWNMFCKPNDMSNWFKEDNARGPNTPFPSIPFNKAMDVAECMLHIYHITGEKVYKEKAEKVFNRVKAGMNNFKGGYTWNYWEPISSADVNVNSTRNERILSHWVGTHPYRDYQDGEVSKIVYAYDMGVTFTENDIRKIINTNLKFMWNGNMEKPEWANSDSKLPGYQKAPPSEAYPTTAGTYWSALSRFDPTICKLANMARSRNRDANRETPECNIDFKRKYAPRAKVNEPEWMKGIGESEGQAEAVAIPSVIPAGEGSVILSKSDGPMSDVDIYVRPLKGGTPVKLTTQKMGNGIQLFYVWDGNINGKRSPGKYVIIWEYRGGKRAYPVTIM